MIDADNPEIASLPRPDDISIGELLGFLADHSDKPLVFLYDGRPVRPGYHVTEVKAARFSALDCGANPEAWPEIFVQLWDVDEQPRQHMPAGKFKAIITKVSDHVALEADAKLTFEVSDGIAPMRLYKAGSPEIVDSRVHVALAPRPASCKPRDRWLESQGRNGAGCCGDSAPA
ncbi:DUF6428 family protein [Inquilinus sp. CAU 1745]|uniref:DUF6428 family protein n=1 Tax=Inquilinus sp. CAU 1745 TaxID=3140369 RepID=UPI00325A4A33